MTVTDDVTDDVTSREIRKTRVGSKQERGDEKQV